MILRPARRAEMGALGALFHDAVRRGAAPAYTEAERAAWSPAPPGARAFAERLEGQWILVAEEDGALRGFASLSPDGLLDMLFVTPEARGTGVAGRLLDAVEETAREAGLTHLRVEASHMLRPLLLKRGWTMIGPNSFARRGVTLWNWRMERALVAPRADWQ